jgi:hypothetical protein
MVNRYSYRRRRLSYLHCRRFATRTQGERGQRLLLRLRFRVGRLKRPTALYSSRSLKVYERTVTTCSCRSRTSDPDRR